MTTKCPCCGTQSDSAILIDETSHIVAVDNLQIRMPDRCIRLLRLLLRAVPHPVERDTLIAALWHEKHEPDDAEASLRVIISQMRHAFIGSKVALRSVYGVGYRLERTDLSRDRLLVAQAITGLMEAANA